MNRFALSLSLLFVVALAASASAGADVVTFTDGSFAAQDWAQTIFYTHGYGIAQTVSTVASGGDNGAYREVTNIVGASPPGTYSCVWGFERYLPGSYDPGATGAILGVNYSEDCIQNSLPYANFIGQATGPAIRQNGNVYVHLGLLTTEAGWTHKSWAGLLADDFRDLLDANAHPDFSAAGAPIEVGFYRGNSTSLGNHAYTVGAGIDNWDFEILYAQPINAPEPATLALLGMGLVTILRRKSGNDARPLSRRGQNGE
jgi:hypothetical protein